MSVEPRGNTRGALILDGHATRRVFPGLHNNKQHADPDDSDPRLWLPNQGLPSPLRPASIVRINCAQEEMPRLTYVSERLKSGEEKGEQGAAPDRRDGVSAGGGRGHPLSLNLVSSAIFAVIAFSRRVRGFLLPEGVWALVSFISPAVAHGGPALLIIA